MHNTLLSACYICVWGIFVSANFVCTLQECVCVMERNCVCIPESLRNPLLRGLRVVDGGRKLLIQPGHAAPDAAK